MRPGTSRSGAAHGISDLARSRLSPKLAGRGLCRVATATPRWPHGPAMYFTRPIIFWTAMLASVIAVVVLLRGVLLPFVAGMVLAYLLNPVVSRIERLGMSRLLATLAIMAIVVVAIAVLMVFTVPTIVSELSYFIQSLPLYLRRLQTLTTDPSRPWLSKIVGE